MKTWTEAPKQSVNISVAIRHSFLTHTYNSIHPKTMKSGASKAVRMAKSRIRSFLKPAILPILELICFFSSELVSFTHKILMKVQWGWGAQPEHFDHQIDLFYQWLKTRNSLGWERGVFGSLALKGEDVLELACGDGFNARNFYSLRSRKVIACDFDESAIRTAKKKNSAENIEFLLADIRTNMPSGKFKNVVWDAAIEHFTPTEIGKIMSEIKDRLTPDGILSGYTIVEKSPGVQQLSHHEYEFKDKNDLMRFLAPHFRNINVFETIFPDRHNLYFWASDESIPFSNDWAHSITQVKINH